MIKTINGRDGVWPKRAEREWRKLTAAWKTEDVEACTRVNYFTPRPYRNEYNRGSEEEGFIYIIRGSVCYHHILGSQQ
jgi:hypothetical protein